jgi:hypothetical protein
MRRHWDNTQVGMAEYCADVRRRDRGMAAGAAEHCNGVALKVNHLLLAALLRVCAELANLLRPAGQGRWRSATPG